MKKRTDLLLMLRRYFIVSATVLGLASCASTQMVHQWSNPAYTSPSFKKVMVIA